VEPWFARTHSDVNRHRSPSSRSRPQRVGRATEFRFRMLELLQILVAHLRCGELRRERLELSTHEERFPELLTRERSDADAAVRLEGDEAVATSSIRLSIPAAPTPFSQASR
jgi:hypothetical protein